MQNRKQKAWKKSRKFGDVHGGRKWPKVKDKIINRVHSLKPPTPHQELPIIMMDNPSKDFFYPIHPDEVLAAMKHLPSSHLEGITHIWFKRAKKSDYIKRKYPLASYSFIAEVVVIIFYPWPKHMRLYFGKKKPSKRTLNSYSNWCTDLRFDRKGYFLQWELKALRIFYLEHLLLHEIGHHVSYSYRYWSPASRKKAEDFANAYAVEWFVTETIVFDSRT